MGPGSVVGTGRNSRVGGRKLSLSVKECLRVPLPIHCVDSKPVLSNLWPS